ncbi:hypothetical protein [Flavivirga rizhaonensis]|uniref:Uncharacterized protein n=1 Tax=Flavivirga rizhaonensis TaxID=2559571 RepID=A0A4S1DW38_9FLAO|nr:hypothetical protein [Flavivirga rizhaonensis]TGV02095.1 hypothetical protein EM932_13010 [Flavivirga rizhaonensis]
MKSKMRTLLLMPFFALLLFTSCQEEKVDITPPAESEALVANSELTSFISATSAKDGSADNIIDKASCLSVELPVTVVVNGLEIIVDSTEDYKVIEAIFNKFEDDDDKLEIVFPITIVLADHTEIVLNNRTDLENLIKECKGENEADDDIECIDFQYPISFSVYDTEFQVIDVITVENDRQLHRFVKRVANAEVLASLNFPVTMIYADGSTTVVNNNEELESTINEAKDDCDEDDDNDYGDDDFTKERLDEYLKICPWVVHEFKRDNQDNTPEYKEYALNFKEDGVVVMRARGGDILTGTWNTRVTDRGALLKLEFDTLADFTLEWVVYDIEYGKIKLYEVGGNRIIMKKNCDVVIDHTKERVENYLQECLWRVARLSVDGADNEKDYIGTPLKFFANNVVKIRVNGELVEGTYEVLVRNNGLGLSINLEGRPNLKLEWLITFLEPGLIKLESLNNRENKMVLKRHCPEGDEDINYINDVLTSPWGGIWDGGWTVASYLDGDVEKKESFELYVITFSEEGKINVYKENNNDVKFDGSWLAYRNDDLFLGMHFGIEAPFNDLNHRWVIKSITSNRIELKDYNANGGIERILVLEHVQ